MPIAQQQYARPRFYSADREREVREEKDRQEQEEARKRKEMRDQYLLGQQMSSFDQTEENELQVSLTDLRWHYTYHLNRSKEECLLRDREHRRKLAKALRTVHNYFAYTDDHLPQDPDELSPKQLAKAARRQAKARI